MLPTYSVLKLLHKRVAPMLTQIAKLETANAKLHQARDLLLPRLMRGELKPWRSVRPKQPCSNVRPPYWRCFATYAATCW